MPKTPDELGLPRRSMIILRRRIFTTLVALSVGTFLLGLIPAWSEFLRIHLFIDLMVVGFVMYLLQEKYRRSIEQSTHAIGVEPEDEEIEYLRAEHF